MAEAPADLAIIDMQSQRETATVRDWLLELLDDVTPILLLSPEPDPTISSRIRQARVGGLLQSNASSEQIVQSIKLIASGLMILDNALMPQVVEDEAFVEPLTPRESEVLRLLADGLGNKDIATTLNISEHTIKFHIHSILGKLGATSRTEAVTRGLRSGLIEL
jgi:DNA-binding NarL/FixJ family response regulator